MSDKPRTFKKSSKKTEEKRMLEKTAHEEELKPQNEVIIENDNENLGKEADYDNKENKDENEDKGNREDEENREDSENDEHESGNKEVVNKHNRHDTKKYRENMGVHKDKRDKKNYDTRRTDVRKNDARDDNRDPIDNYLREQTNNTTRSKSKVNFKYNKSRDSGASVFDYNIVIDDETPLKECSLITAIQYACAKSFFEKKTKIREILNQLLLAYDAKCDYPITTNSERNDRMQKEK